MKAVLVGSRQLCAVPGWRMVALALYATAMDKSLFEASPLASAFCGTIVPCWTQCNARPLRFPAFRPVFSGNKNAGLARLRGGAADKDFAYEFREQGLELLAAGATAAALAAYENAVEIAPTDADSLVALGRLLDQVRGNQQHAFDLFVRAVECAPDNLVALSNYAFGLENWCDRPLLAENVYRRAEALDPSNVPVLINLASLLEQPLPERDPRYNTEAEARNLRQRESHKLYERALALEPTNRNTLCNYAGMLMTWGDQGDCSESGMQRGGERAAELFERALVLAPNDPAVLINYGVLMEDWGDNKELARHLYQKAVDADPASSAAVCSLARILRVLQRLDEAQDVASAAIALYPAESKCEDVLDIERELWRVRQTINDNSQSKGAGGGGGGDVGGLHPPAHPRIDRDANVGLEESGEDACSPPPHPPPSLDR